MGVLQAFPRRAKSWPVNLFVWPQWFWLVIGFNSNPRDLFRMAVPVDESLIGRCIRFSGDINFMHRVTGFVEELQTATRTAFGVFSNGKRKMPMVQE